MSHMSRNAALCLSVLAIMQSTDHGYTADISFADRFKKYTNENHVVVQASPTDTLIIEEGIYVLDGRPLVLAAEKVRIDGDVRIISFQEDDRPEVVPGVADTGPSGSKGADFNCGRSGCNGEPGKAGMTGQMGATGRTPGRIEVDVEQLEGNGTLEIFANGQTGGQGQKGGKGGTGGQAGRGADISCGGLAGLDTKASAGNAGAAGRGGPRGQGGRGGAGGQGGEVALSKALLDRVRAGTIKVSAPGGAGGIGGEPGEKGNGGSGNDGGGGGSCGGGGKGSGNGPEGPDGQTSEIGDTGPGGRITFSSFGEGAEGTANATIDLAQYDVEVKRVMGWDCDKAKTVFATKYCVPETILPELSYAKPILVEELQSFDIVTTPSDDGHCMSVALNVKQQKTWTLECPRGRVWFMLEISSSPNL